MFGCKSTDFIFALSQLITFLQNIQTQVRKTNVRKDVSIPRSRCRIFGNSNLTHFGCEVRVLISSNIILEFRIRCLHVTAVQQKVNSTPIFRFARFRISFTISPFFSFHEIFFKLGILWNEILPLFYLNKCRVAKLPLQQ